MQLAAKIMLVWQANKREYRSAQFHAKCAILEAPGFPRHSARGYSF
jgi:hypothetical protein